MEEDLWKKVHLRLFPEDYETSDDSNETIEDISIEETYSKTEPLVMDVSSIENVSLYLTLRNFLNSLALSSESLFNPESALFKILKQGVFSGFLHLFIIVFFLGTISSYLFTIPAWFCGMVAGFFAGKKSGDTIRAAVAAILLFSIAYFFFTLFKFGLFPPVSDNPIDSTHTFSISVFEWLLGGTYNFGGISGLVNPSSHLFISSVCFSVFGSYIEIFKIPTENKS